MISLKENEVALRNISVTLDAIKNLETIINMCRKPLPGPVYCAFHIDPSDIQVQFDRTIALEAIQNQRDKLIGYLETLGIEYNL